MNILTKLINKRILCHKNVPLLGTRTLFTPDSLGVTAYIVSREEELEYNKQHDEFKKEFLKKIDQSVSLFVLIDNLKRYIHVMSDERNDIELLWRALRLFKSQYDRTRRLGQIDEKKIYTFGPTTMRVLHYYKLPEYAIKFFDDGNITELFDQLTTYQILLDLLYDHRMYGDALRIYGEIEKRILDKDLYVSSALNSIIFATYFRLNTPIHDELAYDMYEKLKQLSLHTKQYRKSIALVAAMKLRRQQPDESLEILSIHDDIDVNIRYVRILSHAYLNQFDEVFRLLKMTIVSDHTNQKIYIPDQLLQKVEGKMRYLRDDKINQQYKLISDELKRLNLIFYKRLDDVLCARFTTKMCPYKPKKDVGLGCF